MSDPKRSQCLIFLTHEGSLEDVRLGRIPLEQVECKGYALLSVAVENDHPRVRELFEDSGIEIIDINEEHPALEAALRNDKVGIVELLLDERRSFYRCDLPAIFSPFFLHVGVHRYNKILVEELLSKMIIVHADKNFDTAEFSSVFDEENLTSIEQLLSHRADIPIMHRNGGTLLHLAVNRGLTTVVQLLIQAGANVNIKNAKGLTALALAVDKGNEEIVSLLLSNGANIDVAVGKDGFSTSPLHTAALMGHLRIVEELLQHGVNFDLELTGEGDKGITPLYFATCCRKIEVVKLLLGKGANVNAKGVSGSVLRSAIFSSHPELLDCILSYQPAINYPDDKSAFLYLIREKLGENKEVVEKLLQYGFSITTEDAEDPRLLLGAVRQNGLMFVRKIIDCGADVNKPSNVFSCKQVTPLHLAAGFADVDLIRFLLESGADITAKCSLGRTAIFYAAENNKVKNLELLFKSGATQDVMDEKCLSALHVAAENGSTDVCVFLIGLGANINAKCNDDETPIFKAARKGHLSVVESLLKYNAEVDLKNKKGKTVLHEASYHGHTQILQTLLEHSFMDLNRLRETNIFRYYNMNDCRGDEDIIAFHFGTDNFEPSDKIFKQHVFKMYAISPHSERDELSFFHGENWSEFRKASAAEIVRLKNEKLGDTDLLIYDVLQSDAHRLARLFRNDAIVQCLNSNDLKTKFPIYASNLICQFQKGMQRKELVKRGIKIGRALFSFWDLPYDLEEKILNYLSNNEILVLMTACCHVK